MKTWKRIAALCISVSTMGISILSAGCENIVGGFLSSSQGSSVESSTEDSSSEIHTHEWTEEVVKAATCTDDGKKVLKCDCGEEKEETVPAGHDLVYTTVQEASCTQAGLVEITCKNCEYEMQETQSQKDHMFLFGGDCHWCGKSKEEIENGNTVYADKYKITVACQTEMGEEEVLKCLVDEYEKKNPDVEIEIKTFSGEAFEQYMLGIAQNLSNSPNIIWTADMYHSPWHQYFTDLRPYYEASAETDYSLYYESMLDAASINGTFKPTKNYMGAFNREKDANSDGKEDYKNHSEYGLYYAPRDYNKPAILCNTHLFAELDEAYALVYKAKEGVTEMPAGYKTTTARLQEIVAGTDWDELNDLFVFAKLIADRMVYIVDNADRNLGRKWAYKAVLNLFLDWESVYTTIMNDMGVDLINADGTLNLSAHESALENLHGMMFPEDNSKNYMLTTNGGVSFSSGNLFMNVCSRPVALGYSNTFQGTYGDTCLEAIHIPIKDIAESGSGYAISNIWEGQGMTVNGVYKSYSDLSWDFIKFIITEEGQEVAGATGLNIPVLKSLYETGEWRKVESLGSINHDAWVAGGELRMDTYNIFKAEKRNMMRSIIKNFFTYYQSSNYTEGSLTALIEQTTKSYNICKPTDYLRG